MKILTFSIVLMLVASMGVAYEVVLNDGKVVNGKLIFESEQLIVLKDATGVLVNFKKSDIDLLQTAERNKQATDPKGKATQKKSRTYTKEDLEEMPELSDFSGTEEESPQTEPQTQAQTQTQSQTQTDSVKKPALKSQFGEEYWKSEVQRLMEEIKDREYHYEKFKRVCDQTDPQAAKFTGTVEQFEKERKAACKRMEDNHEIFKDKIKEYELLLKKAQKEGVPPAWLTTDRSE